jgi:hypothetical protein
VGGGGHLRPNQQEAFDDVPGRKLVVSMGTQFRPITSMLCARASLDLFAAGGVVTVIPTTTVVGGQGQRALVGRSVGRIYS